MSVVVTGATGHLGRLVVESLLGQGVPARDITAAGRDTTKVKDLADHGVPVRAIDYDDPATLDDAFRGAGKILLISASVPGQRARQHGHAIDAARRAGAGLLAYTSIVNADTTSLRLAAEHQATEAVLRASGLPYVLLRNSWYTENYTAQIPAILQRGSLPGSAGEGRVSAATPADYAAAAAAVLASDGHAGRVYELGGDQAFTLAELAAEISAQSAQPVSYRDLPEAEYAQLLTSAGVPSRPLRSSPTRTAAWPAATFMSAAATSRQLTGRPTTSLHDAVAAALH